MAHRLQHISDLESKLVTRLREKVVGSYKALLQSVDRHVHNLKLFGKLLPRVLFCPLRLQEAEVVLIPLHGIQDIERRANCQQEMLSNIGCNVIKG